MEYESLADVAQLLIREQINELPVVDGAKRLIGQINMHEIIAATLQKAGVHGATG